MLDLILLSDIKLIGITHGVQKPGFCEDSWLQPTDSEKTRFLWWEWVIPDSLIKFIFANYYNHQVAGKILADKSQCQVSETKTPHDFVDFDAIIIIDRKLKPL